MKPDIESWLRLATWDKASFCPRVSCLDDTGCQRHGDLKDTQWYLHRLPSPLPNTSLPPSPRVPKEGFPVRPKACCLYQGSIFGGWRCAGAGCGEQSGAARTKGKVTEAGCGDTFRPPGVLDSLFPTRGRGEGVRQLLGWRKGSAFDGGVQAASLRWRRDVASMDLKTAFDVEIPISRRSNSTDRAQVMRMRRQTAALFGSFT